MASPFLINLRDLALDGLKTADKSRLDPIVACLIVFGLSLIGLEVWAIGINHQEFNPIEFSIAGAGLFSGQSLNLFTQHRAQKGGLPPVERVTEPEQ